MLCPPGADGVQPEQHLHRPDAARIRAVFHGYRTAVHGGQRAVPHRRTPGRAWKCRNALGLDQECIAAKASLWRCRFSPLFAPLPAARAAGLPAALHDRLGADASGRDPCAAIALLEQRLFLGERLLRDTDAASMASSIEIRLPLVDRDLLDAVDRLPPRQRFMPLGRKAVLRRTGLAGLDSALFERPKSGFVLPFDRWIRASLGKRMDATMRDPQALAAAGFDPDTVGRLWHAFLAGAPGIYWSRVWAIYAFVRWCQRHSIAV